MCFLVLEDLTGTVDVTVFPKVYEQYRSQLSEGKILLVHGSINVRNDKAGVILEKCAAIASDIESLHIVLKEESNETELREINYIIKEYSGYIPLYLHVSKKTILAGNHLHIQIKDDLITRLRALSGVNDVYTGYKNAAEV